MSSLPSEPSPLPPDERESIERSIRIWAQAGPLLEQIRADELRQSDAYRAIELLCGDFDYTVPPRAPKPTSGLVEQQRWFKKAAGRE